MEPYTVLCAGENAEPALGGAYSNGSEEEGKGHEKLQCRAGRSFREFMFVESTIKTKIHPPRK